MRVGKICAFVATLACLIGGSPYLAYGSEFPKVPQTNQAVIERALTGDANAQHYLGYVFLSSKEQNDPEKAIAWFQLAADQNLAKSEYMLGQTYGFEEGGPHDYKTSILWLERSLLPRAQNNTHYREGTDTKALAEKSLKYICKHGLVDFPTKSAVGQNKQCVYARANRYFKGADDTVQDIAKAHNWFERAAKLGSVDAMVQLGENYKNGVGVTQNMTMARQYAQQAADNGHGPYAYTVAENARKNGNSVRELKYLMSSAKSGFTNAFSSLGQKYSTGRGVEQDYIKAEAYYILSGRKLVHRSPRRHSYIDERYHDIVSRPEIYLELEQAKLFADNFATENNIPTYRLEKGYLHMLDGVRFYEKNGQSTLVKSIFGTLMFQLTFGMILVVLTGAVSIRKKWPAVMSENYQNYKGW